MVKARAITQAEVDVREAAAADERAQSEALAKIKDRQVVMARLTLWMLRYVWPRLTTEERGQVKAIIPEKAETEIRNALEKLP